jgi:hypothetical protein
MADTKQKVKSEKMDRYVAHYIALRDRRKVLKDAYEAEDKGLRDLQTQVEGKLREFMDAHGLENLKTAHGTCYTSTKFTASVQDAEVFMEFIKRTQAWDLIERRANATAVKDFIKEHNQEPPGVHLSAIQTVGVRRLSEKKE